MALLRHCHPNESEGALNGLALEISVAVAIALSGVLPGWIFSRLRNPYWAIGYVIPLGLIFIFALANLWPSLSVAPPISWIVLGRNKYAFGGFISTFILTAPLSRLRQKPARVLLCAMMAVLVFGMCVWPLLPSMLDRAELLRLKTQIDANGICLQSNEYTCGAAAAVTALRKFGFPAEEGDIAVLARTSYFNGTEPDILAEQLQKRYGKDGLIAEYRVFQKSRRVEKCRLDARSCEVRSG